MHSNTYFCQVLNSTGILNICVCYLTKENEDSIHNNKQLQNKLLNCSDCEEMITMNINVFFMPSHAVW